GRYASRDFRFTYPVPPDDFLVPSTNAFNHLGGPVLVAYDFSRDFGPVLDTGPTKSYFGSAAVKGVLPKGWQINLAGAYAKESAGINVSESPEGRGRLVRSGFFELAVPMVGPPASATANRLDLSFAGRYDSYSDVGGTFNPKVGFSWRPFALIKVRGNWGTSFRAPPFFFTNHDQVGDAAIQDVVDPRSATGSTRALLLFGPGPDLKPETAHTWNAG